MTPARCCSTEVLSRAITASRVSSWSRRRSRSAKRRALAPGAYPTVMRLSRRTNRPGFYPGIDQRTGFLLRAGGRGSAEARLPCPTDQSVGTDVMDEVFDFPAAVTGGVLDLRADLGRRLAFPRHLARRDMPFRVARYAAGVEVRILVTDRTAHRLCTMTVNAALDGRLVQPALVTLARAVAGRMAINAARMRQHLAKLGEHCSRSRVGVGDRGKTFRRSQRVRSGLRSRVTGQHAHSKRCDRNEDLKPHVRLHCHFALLGLATLNAGDNAQWPRRPLNQITFRIGENHVTHGLVVFDVAGTAADVPVERLRDRVLKLGTRHLLFRQPLEQHLGLVQEAGGAVAA